MTTLRRLLQAAWDNRRELAVAAMCGLLVAVTVYLFENRAWTGWRMIAAGGMTALVVLVVRESCA